MSITQNLKTIHDTIHNAATDWGRDERDIALIAVSKNQDDDKIRQALDAGHRIFGENRVQEAYEHWSQERARYDDLMLHLIGPLQTNKINDAIALFDVIHTIDREKLARKLGDALKAQGKSIPCFIQVNIGEEEQKAGIAPAGLPAFLAYCRDECGLDIIGLMCIPPVDEPAALYFALLQKMARHHGLPHLSMGMSDDYEKAIPLGATFIRVGSAIFGNRP